KLVVDGCGITDDFFNNVAEFPHLETLFLADCPKLKRIKITSNSLISFDIEECPNLSEVEVDCPKLFLSRYSSSSKNKMKRRFSRRRRLPYLPFPYKSSCMPFQTIKPKEVNALSFSYFFLLLCESIDFETILY
ncbi:hypothetical protein KSS87_014971, partial [Heliosperma pusillum]